jgi:hypothetical protein
MDTKEQTKREPLFTEGDYKKMQDVFPYASLEFVFGAKAMMEIYEAKITGGELGVVGTILRSELNMHIRKEHNIAWDAAGAAWVTHCPGCGAKIVKP